MTAHRLLLAALFFLGWNAASAQNLDFASGGNGAPVEIRAEQGLELVQNAKQIIARGNARASRGSTTLAADVILAHYRDGQGAGGKTEIWRIEAQGHVVISTPTQTITAEHGDYNIDKAAVILTGNNLKLTTATDTVTARDSLEYWERTQQAVARGDALAIHDNDRIRANVLTATMGPDEQGKTSIRKIRADDNVVLTTPRETVTGDRGDYTVESGIVTLTGSVKMTRDNNQLDGGYAIVNLKSGVSRLLPTPPGSGAEGRVKGTFVPQSKNTPAPDARAPRPQP